MPILCHVHTDEYNELLALKHFYDIRADTGENAKSRTTSTSCLKSTERYFLCADRPDMERIEPVN